MCLTFVWKFLLAKVKIREEISPVNEILKISISKDSNETEIVATVWRGTMWLWWVEIGMLLAVGMYVTVSKLKVEKDYDLEASNYFYRAPWTLEINLWIFSSITFRQFFSFIALRPNNILHLVSLFLLFSLHRISSNIIFSLTHSRDVCNLRWISFLFRPFNGEIPSFFSFSFISSFFSGHKPIVGLWQTVWSMNLISLSLSYSLKHIKILS